MFPIKTAARRLAVIGESPGADESNWHLCTRCGYGYSPVKSYSGAKCPSCGGAAVHTPTPFVGPSGLLLNKLLAEVGIEREACFVGNVCQVQPPGNKISLFKWDGPEIQSGLEALSRDLAAYSPHFCLLLGNTALKAFLTRQKAIVSDWRGSLFLADGVATGVKCMATYHPAALLREPALTAACRFDFKRLRQELAVDGLVLPKRDIEINLSKDELLTRLAAIQAQRTKVALDIEGGVGGIGCVGFADSASHAFVVPFSTAAGESVWSEEDEFDLWLAVGNVLHAQDVPKVLQNALYENFVLAWAYGIVIRGTVDDTMLKWHELYCELEKALEFQASILTRQPNWKIEHKLIDGRYVPYIHGRPATSEEWYHYNGMDCCLTFECNEAMEQRLMPGQRKHYQFNLSLLPAVTYMELRGIRYDYEAAKAKLKRVQRWAWVLQDIVNRAAGITVPPAPSTPNRDAAAEHTADGQGMEKAAQEGRVSSGTWEHDLVPIIAANLCLAKPRRREEVTTTRTFKNGKTKTTTKVVSKPATIETLADCKEFALPSQKGAMRRVCALVGGGSLSRSQRGELSTLLGTHVKVNSTGAGGDACRFLYETCGFPRQYQKEGNRLTDRLASDDEALLHIWLKTKDKRCKAFLLLRRLLTKAETLRVGIDADGRIRTAYNLVATKTGRMAAYASPTGNGYNTQTTTKNDRDLFLADEGHDMWQRDLSAADAWTVAAHAALQGDMTMLDDMRAGLKPAKIVCLLHDHGLSINQLSRDKLKEMCAAVNENGWLYHASKATVYGSSYGMYERTMSENLLIQSFKKSGKPIAVPPAMCKKLQELYFARYPGIRRWHAHTDRLLRSTGTMICPSGLKRLFFGRKDEQATLRDALSHEPQNNTTYALNKAIANLWYDPENRRADGSLIAEPIHQIHDAALFQAPSDKREWVAVRSDQWFNNPLVIAGQEVTIPAGKEYGPNWRQMVKWKVAATVPASA